MKKCVICHKELPSNKRTLCGDPKCRELRRAENGIKYKPRRKKNEIEKFIEHDEVCSLDGCDTVYLKTRRNMAYCCPEHQKQNTIEKKKSKTKCKVCGKKPEQPRKRYCDEHRPTSRSKQNKHYYKMRALKPKYTIKCKCGNEFITTNHLLVNCKTCVIKAKTEPSPHLREGLCECGKAFATTHPRKEKCDSCIAKQSKPKPKKIAQTKKSEVEKVRSVALKKAPKKLTKLEKEMIDLEKELSSKGTPRVETTKKDEIKPHERNWIDEYIAKHGVKTA